MNFYFYSGVALDTYYYLHTTMFCDRNSLLFRQLIMPLWLLTDPTEYDRCSQQPCVARGRKLWSRNRRAEFLWDRL